AARRGSRSVTSAFHREPALIRRCAIAVWQTGRKPLVYHSRSWLTAIYQSVGVCRFYFPDAVKIQGGSMLRSGFVGLAVVLLSNAASAEPMSLAPLNPDDPPTVMAAAQQPQEPSNPVAGLFESIFGNGQPPSRRGPQQWFGQPPERNDYRDDEYRGYGNAGVDPRMDYQRYDGRMDPRFMRQEVWYGGKEGPGTVVIDKRNE